jgi:succinate dehydrogenase / fumarate reductase cytochrome b subunit
VISQGAVQGPEAFSELMERLEHPLFIVLDLALIGAVLYHGMNGIRILLFDVGVGIRRHKPIFAGVMAAGAACLLAFAVVSFTFIF